MATATNMDIGDIRICQTNSSHDASQNRGVYVTIERTEAKKYLVRIESWSQWEGDTGEISERVFSSLPKAEAEAEANCRTRFGDCEWSWD